jgi:hypothetical protein
MNWINKEAFSNPYNTKVRKERRGENIHMKFACVLRFMYLTLLNKQT